MNLIFFGGGEVAAETLRCLILSYTVCLVVTPPPRQAGRHLTFTPPPALAMASALGLPVKHDADAATLRQHKPDTLIVCDYGFLLSADCLAVAPALNIHPSLLPRWRGAAPIQRALLAGDETTGVTIMRLNTALDGGDILAQWETAITAEMTGGALTTLLTDAGIKLLLHVLKQPEAFSPTSQTATAATYAKKITTADRRLNFADSAAVCERQVRAFAPSPGAYCFLAEERLKVLAASVADMPHTHQPGAVLAADTDVGFIVACGEGALKLTVVQRGGRAAMPAADFLRGCRLSAAQLSVS